MGEVGHGDSKMTLDVSARLQQRGKREHGRAFDTLVRQAREQHYGITGGLPEPAPEAKLATSLATPDYGRVRAAETRADPAIRKP
jgi:hypothetical protein